ncbi:DNA double-strand break repair nuclease NurA [Miniphocaeibacter halophilus]|uniref:DNA double-strand break repair nuclease NurA n=1 Tax=Miniphocaeibacter halophilus TaxID=2931922 RepID=A0AC61MSD4_9FIRM|nr:DNA double-strand break repair nuclease NurA [Miniphocaeibacter halophilus]QQK07336.1 DNA double-strand break repair nuclease NurA [Miniphocaeibacter halophilus]
MEEKLSNELKKLNNLLIEKYYSIDKYNRDEKRNLLSKVGNYINIKSLKVDELKEIKDLGGVIAVDGSTNKFGGAFPHYVQMFKAVASFGLKENENIEIADLYCPLIEEGNIYEEKKIIDKKLAEIELKAAIEAIKNNPKIIIMDGSLIRYRILAENLWVKLKDLVIKNNIILIGVVEDIKTSVIYDNIYNINHENNTSETIYDREFIFDALDSLEALYLNKQKKGKDSFGFRSTFFRSSQAPSAIAVDILEEQEQYLEFCLSLLASITDVNSRGVPFILDIADVQARITNDLTKQLIKTYINVEFYEKLFNAQRFKRSF